MKINSRIFILVLLLLFCTNSCSNNSSFEINELSPDIVSGIKIVDVGSMADDEMFVGNWRGPRYLKRYFREMFGKEGGLKFLIPRTGSIIIETELETTKNSDVEFFVNGKISKKIHFLRNDMKKIRIPILKNRISEKGVYLKFKMNSDTVLKLFSAKAILSKYINKYEGFNENREYITIPSKLKYQIIPKEGDYLKVKFDSPVNKSELAIYLNSKIVKKITIRGAEQFKIELEEWKGKPVKIIVDLKDSKKLIKILKSELINDRGKKDSILKYVQRIKDLKGRFNVLLIVLDSMRADRFSYMGYKRIVAPNIERLSESSIVFNNYWSEAAYTLASTATLLSGLPPDYHNVTRLFSGGLNKGITTLAENFNKGGFFTAAVSANPFFGSDYNMDQGFSLFIELFRKKDQVRAEEFFTPFKKILETVKRKSKNFFVYLHIREPHIDYLMPPPFFGKFHRGKWKYGDNRFNKEIKKIFFKKRKRSSNDIKLLNDCYDENLAYADSEVGKILNLMKKRDFMDKSIVIITSDHGESLGEHGLIGHNVVLQREGIQIPLIIHIPGLTKGRRINRESFSTSDLTEFLFSVSGGGLLNKDGLHSEYFRKKDPRTIISRTISFPDFKANYVLKNGKFRCIINVVKNQTPVIYEIVTDPKEERPIRNLELENYFLFQLRSFFRLKKKFTYQSKNKKIDLKVRKKLKSLGYM